MSESKFVTCINCMDGRVQEPAIAYLKERFGADHVDMITEPGPDAILSEKTDETKVDSIERRVRISVEKHLSGAIAIAGHFDCAGNPCCREAHIEQIKKAAEVIEEWGFNVPVLGLWLNKDFCVEEVVPVA